MAVRREGADDGRNSGTRKSEKRTHWPVATTHTTSHVIITGSSPTLLPACRFFYLTRGYRVQPVPRCFEGFAHPVVWVSGGGALTTV